jgi:hypothetical protein
MHFGAAYARAVSLTGIMFSVGTWSLRTSPIDGSRSRNPQGGSNRCGWWRSVSTFTNDQNWLYGKPDDSFRNATEEQIIKSSSTMRADHDEICRPSPCFLIDHIANVFRKSNNQFRIKLDTGRFCSSCTPCQLLSACFKHCLLVVIDQIRYFDRVGGHLIDNVNQSKRRTRFFGEPNGLLQCKI